MYIYTYQRAPSGQNAVYHCVTDIYASFDGETGTEQQHNGGKKAAYKGGQIFRAEG